MSARSTLDCGSLEFPTDWEQKPSATLAMPAQDMPLMRAGKAAEAQTPQPNIVVTLTEGSASTEQALATVVEALTAAIPGLTREEPEAFGFADDSEGQACRVTFPAANLKLVQWHVVRPAGKRIAHLCATALADREQDLEKLLEVARSYRPPTD